MERNTQKDLRKLATAFFEVFFDYFELDNIFFGSINFESNYLFADSWIERKVLRSIGWEPERPEKEWLLAYSEKQLLYARDLYFKELMPYLEKLWIDGNKK